MSILSSFMIFVYFFCLITLKNVFNITVPDILYIFSFIIIITIIVCEALIKILIPIYKIKKFTEVFREYENISAGNHNKNQITPRLMGEIDKESFKAYANAMVDM